MIIDIFHRPILGQVNIGIYLEKNHVTSERDYRRNKMADEVSGICHKWDICYENELEMNINRYVSIEECR